MDHVRWSAFLPDLGLLRVAAHRKTAEMDQHDLHCALSLRLRYIKAKKYITNQHFRCLVYTTNPSQKKQNKIPYDCYLLVFFKIFAIVCS